MAESAEPAVTYDVSCAANQEKKDKLVLIYEVDDPENRITWEWTEHKIKKEDDTDSKEYIAELRAKDSKRGHKSRPVPDEIYHQLGSPKKKRKARRDDKSKGIYKVKMSFSGEDIDSVRKYFTLPC